MSSFSTDDHSEDRSNDLDLSQVLRVLRERKWIIIGLAVVALAASLVNSFLSTPQYRATAKVVMQTATLDKALFGTQVFQIYDQQRSLETAADLVRLTRVGEAVIGWGRIVLRCH